MHTTINIRFFYHSGCGNKLILHLCVLGELIDQEWATKVKLGLWKPKKKTIEIEKLEKVKKPTNWGSAKEHFTIWNYHNDCPHKKERVGSP